LAKGNLKPMLAGKITDYDKLKYPFYASPKLDGVRGIVKDGELVSRKLMTFPNIHINAEFSNASLDGMDGELIVGSATNPQVRNLTSGSCNRIEGTPEVTFYIFDNYKYRGGFTARYGTLIDESIRFPDNVRLVPQHLISNAEELAKYEADTLDLGYEGVIIRSLGGPYKMGRSTENEGYMLKVKRFLDAEAEILEVIEEEENTNVAQRDNLGRTKRSHAQDGKVPKGRAGALHVKDLVSGVEFTVGSGMDDDERKFFWDNRRKVRGKCITYRYFPKGVKDKPLIPTYVGLREEWDL